MNKNTISLLLTTSLIATLSVGAHAKSDKSHMTMEKCAIVSQDGKSSLIKPNKSSCATELHSCSGQNTTEDTKAWVLMPKGTCDKIKGGKIIK